MQTILVYIAVAAAILFLYRKFFTTKKKGDKNCDTNCGCH